MTLPDSYEKTTVWHSLIFAGIAGVAITLASTGMSLTIGQQLLLLATLLPFTGIPHGALDFNIAREMLEPKMGRLWSAWFLMPYLFLMSAVLLAWQISPTGSLGAFLVITAFHFGFGDTLTTNRTPAIVRIADAAGRGGTVLTFPALFFPDDVVMLFSYLVPESGAVGLIRILELMAPPFAAAILGSIGWHLAQFFIGNDRVSLVRALELIAIVLVFSLLPALLAFTIYFSFLHSIRHLLYVAGNRHGEGVLRSISVTFNQSIPVTFVSIGLGVAAYFLLAKIGLDLNRLTQVIFIGIASVTYPHVAVIALAQHVKILKFQSLLVSN